MKISFNLNKKLIALVMVVSILALSITAFLSFSYAEQILRERTGDQLISESEVRGEAVLFLLETRIKDTQVISTDPMIQLLVEEINGADSQEREKLVKEKRRDFLTQMQAFQKLLGYSIEFEDVKIIGRNGQVFFSLSRTDDNDFADDPLFKRGLNEAFSDFEPAGKDKKMIVVSPIFSQQGGFDSESIGVVVAKMRTTDVDGILLNRSGLGETGEVYMVDENNMMLSESRFLEDVIFKQSVETLPVTKCFEEGRNHVGIYPDYKGVSIYGSSFCAKDVGFVLLAEINEAETIQPIKTLEERMLQTGIIITGGMAILAFILSRTITKPLIKLRNAANDIAHGNFDVKTSINTGDEIGELSSSFDYMAKQLKESRIEIQKKDDMIKQQEDVLLQFSDHSQQYCVCMIDIMDSTRITARLTDTQTSEFYQIFLNAMASIVREYGGISVKNIGDALLFSFPNLHPDTNEVFQKTIECCLAMGDANEELNLNLRKHHLPPINYRISATYGNVRLARISTSSINDIFGPTVNRCAKINRSAPPNGLVVGTEFYKNAKTLEFDFKKIGDESSQFEAYVVSRRITII